MRRPVFQLQHQAQFVGGQRACGQGGSQPIDQACQDKGQWFQKLDGVLEFQLIFKTEWIFQRKKLALTAAFMQNRPCVLLDEPTAGLDARGREVFTKMLASYALTHCVIVSDHDPVFYAALSSSTYLMSAAGPTKMPADEIHRA